MTVRLSLRHEWTLGGRIGSGGFGSVYAAQSDFCKDAVAKMVPKAPGAQRELLFVDLTGFKNVIPILDSGETEDSFVLVMPRAEKSLRQHLKQVGGPLSIHDTLPVLQNIVCALLGLEGRVVHRDLKPENILLYDGNWCLADFGISRYAESTTSEHTQKFAMSPPYASPERWLHERATIATDVYSLGVIAYEALAGALPFKGPDISSFREQHLYEAASALGELDSIMSALIEECLYKEPEARPSLSNLKRRLGGIGYAKQSSATSKLREASRAEVGRRADLMRQQSQQRREQDRSMSLAETAANQLNRIARYLKESLESEAPSIVSGPASSAGWTLRLNQAEMEFGSPQQSSSRSWGGWAPPAFEVISYGKLTVTIPPDRHGYSGRSHSLWYCDAQEGGKFQWFETAFMYTPLISHSTSYAPFALNPGAESAKALWTGMAEYQVAWPFTAITIGELDDFVERWASWFADAAQGTLRYPSTLPERSPNGSWRSK